MKKHQEPPKLMLKEKCKGQQNFATMPEQQEEHTAEPEYRVGVPEPCVVGW
jgi:hypothetical protein